MSWWMWPCLAAIVGFVFAWRPAMRWLPGLFLNVERDRFDEGLVDDRRDIHKPL